MLTEKQKQALAKFKKEGSKNLTRNEFKHLSTVRQKCISVIRDYDEAVRIIIELEEKRQA